MRWVDETMNEEFTIEPEHTFQTTPAVYLGEASRAAVSFSHALESDGSVTAAVHGSPNPKSRTLGR